MEKPPKPKGAIIERKPLYTWHWDLHRIWRRLRTGNWGMYVDRDMEDCFHIKGLSIRRAHVKKPFESDDGKCPNCGIET